jgi:tetratricopeptide (TPR) repeat protein
MKKSSSKALKIALSVLLLAALAGGGVFFYFKTKPARIQKRADAYFQSGEYDKARIEYGNLLRASPGNPTALQQLGLIWFEQGAPLRAFPFLRSTRESMPENLNARTKFAQTLLGMGAVADARTEALAIFARSPASDDAVTLLAETAHTGSEIEETRKLLAASANSAAGHLALSTLAARSSDPETAKAEIQRALEADPKSSAAHLAMAMVHASMEKPQEAEKEFKAASELAPVRSVARIRFAEFKGLTGAPAEARTLLKETITAAPDFLPAWRGLAQIALAEKNYDDAIANLDQIFLRDGDNLDGKILLSQILLAKGEVKKAVAILEQLSKSYSSVPLVLYQLAAVYLRDANPTQAAATLKKALTLNPEYAEAEVLLAHVNLSTGNPQAVVEPMEKLLKKYPRLAPAQSALANAYRALGKPEAAAGIYQAQGQADPKSPGPQVMLGMTLLQQQKFDEARAAFAKALELSPGIFEIEFQLAELDIRKKDFAAALERAQRELKKKPNSALAQFLEGRIHRAQGDWPKAEAAFLKTLEFDVNFSAAYQELISGYLAAGKLQDAIAQLERRVAANPNDVLALMTTALLYNRMPDSAKARDAYEKVIAKAPNAAVALNNLATMYAGELNDLDKALDLARKAHSVRVANPAVAASISDTLGWIFYRRGDFAQAFPVLQESARKNPSDFEIQFHLAMASYMAGRPDAARQAFLEVEKAPAGSLPALPPKEELQRRLTLLGDGSGKSPEFAVADLQVMVKSHPDDIFAQLRLAEAHERQQDIPNAAAACEQALQLNPKFLPAMLKLARFHAGPLHNVPKALELAKAARELDPSDPQAASVLGTVAFQSGDIARSYSLLQECASTGDPEILHALAWAAYGLGKVDEARETMQRAVDAKLAGPPLEDARSFLAMIALASGASDAAAAEPEVGKLLAADPKYVPALMIRGTLEMQRGDTKAATATYAGVLARFPEFIPAQKDLAALQAQDPANLDSAFALAMKARAALPNDPGPIQTLAEISYRKKEYSRVIQLLQDPRVRKDPSPRSLFFLGMAHVQSQDKTSAREVLQKAVAANLPEPLLTDARKALTELGPE